MSWRRGEAWRWRRPRASAGLPGAGRQNWRKMTGILGCGRGSHFRALQPLRRGGLQRVARDPAGWDPAGWDPAALAPPLALATNPAGGHANQAAAVGDYAGGGVFATASTPPMGFFLRKKNGREKYWHAVEATYAPQDCTKKLHGLLETTLFCPSSVGARRRPVCGVQPVQAPAGSARLQISNWAPPSSSS